MLKYNSDDDYDDDIMLGYDDDDVKLKYDENIDDDYGMMVIGKWKRWRWFWWWIMMLSCDVEE